MNMEPLQSDHISSEGDGQYKSSTQLQQVPISIAVNNTGTNDTSMNFTNEYETQSKQIDINEYNSAGQNNEGHTSAETIQEIGYRNPLPASIMDVTNATLSTAVNDTDADVKSINSTKSNQTDTSQYNSAVQNTDSHTSVETIPEIVYRNPLPATMTGLNDDTISQDNPDITETQIKQPCGGSDKKTNCSGNIYTKHLTGSIPEAPSDRNDLQPNTITANNTPHAVFSQLSSSGNMSHILSRSHRAARSMRNTDQSQTVTLLADTNAYSIARYVSGPRSTCGQETCDSITPYYSEDYADINIYEDIYDQDRDDDVGSTLDLVPNSETTCQRKVVIGVIIAFIFIGVVASLHGYFLQKTHAITCGKASVIPNATILQQGEQVGDIATYICNSDSLTNGTIPRQKLINSTCQLNSDDKTAGWTKVPHCFINDAGQILWEITLKHKATSVDLLPTGEVLAVVDNEPRGQVMMFSSEGLLLPMPLDDSHLVNPIALAVHKSSATVAIADYSTITVFTKAGKQYSEPVTFPVNGLPIDVDFYKLDYILVSTLDEKLLKYTTGGELLWQKELTHGATWVNVNAENDLVLVCDWKRIHVYSSDLEKLYSIPSQSDRQFLIEPRDVTTDSGKILVADFEMNTISVFDLEGQFIRNIVSVPGNPCVLGVHHDRLVVGTHSSRKLIMYSM